LAAGVFGAGLAAAFAGAGFAAAGLAAFAGAAFSAFAALVAAALVGVDFACGAFAFAFAWDDFIPCLILPTLGTGAGAQPVLRTTTTPAAAQGPHAAPTASHHGNRRIRGRGGLRYP
jgi:hypothetical protein